MKTLLLKSRIASRVMAVLLGSATATATATAAIYNVDTNRSKVTLSGSVTVSGVTVAMKEQSPGSLTAVYGGTLNADVANGKIQFTGGNQLQALELNSYRPAGGGEAGTAPASYGATAKATIIIFTADADAASRRIVFDVRSAPLDLANGKTFEAGSINYQFLDTANSVVDFAVSGFIKAKGSKIISGLLTNSVGLSGTIEGGVLTIPVDAVYQFLAKTDSGQEVVFQLFFKGQLVAVEGVAPELPVVNFEPPGSPGQPLKLFWSPSYKLQRATSLSPPNWADFATESPITIPPVQPGEFFRVVHK